MYDSSLTNTMGDLELLLILGLFLNVAQCLESLGSSEEQQLEINNNVTGVLGQDVYLNCSYLGEDEIVMAAWKKEVQGKSKRLVGFMKDKPFSRHADFSNPDSVTNLTVKMAVSSVNAEGEYTCEFVSDEDDIMGKVYLNVVAEPDIHILVNAETVNGTHYQSVSCLAVGGRPTPEVSWLVNGLPPSQDIFTVEQNETVHPNGTSTLSSTLHFPTHLQDRDSVTCVVKHPTLPKPVLTTARVDTFVRPNVSMKAEMVQQHGSDYWVVSCVASGGRPDTDMILALESEKEPHRENSTGLDSQILLVHLPVAEYEGYNVSCMFEHPKFTHKEARVITLPMFYLSGAELFFPALGNSSVGVQTSEAVELTEGQTGVLIRMNVTGNVPSYSVTCTKDAGALPESMELVGSDLSVEGPLSPLHSGLYECVFSYHHHTTTLQFNLTVKTLPVAPSIQVDLQTDREGSVMECLAADAVPEAEVSWVLPEGVSAVPQYSLSSQNGSHSVRGLVLLPPCMPRELTAHCLINHPALEKTQNRSIKLPLCARPNISLSSHPEWRGGEAYTKVQCSVESVAPAAAIRWKLVNSDNSSTVVSERVSEVQSDGSVFTHSSVELLSALYSGHNLSCVVDHLSLEAPEERTLHITEHKAPVLRASVDRPQGSSLWRAECVCSGEGVGTNLSWILPDHLQNQTSLDSYSEGLVETVRLTYLFPVSEHKGQNLSCEHHSLHGLTQRTTAHVPQYPRPNISLSSHPEWRGGEAYTKVQCSVESVAPAAAIRWKLVNSDNSSTVVSERVSEVQSDGSVFTHSSVELLSALYSGHNLSCVVDHLSLEAPEERTLHITEHKAPVLRASVDRPQGSSLWRAECVCSGEGVGTDLSWILPDHLQNQTSLDSYSEGLVETVRLTYLFPVSEHEGQNLSCEHHSLHGLTQTRTVHVPQYHLSLKVVNHTTPLQDRYGVNTGILQLSLHKGQPNQRVLLKVEGSAPDYTLTCQRGDGSFVHTEGAAMVFHSELTPQDEGLYTCHASFYHHTATVSIQVEVSSLETQIFIWVIAGASSALAIILILAVVLWVFCKRNATKKCKKQESLSALTSLVQEPGSPVMKEPVIIEKDGKEYAQLVNYSIVIDVKSTV